MPGSTAADNLLVCGCCAKLHWCDHRLASFVIGIAWLRLRPAGTAKTVVLPGPFTRFYLED